MLRSHRNGWTRCRALYEGDYIRISAVAIDLKRDLGLTVRTEPIRVTTTRKEARWMVVEVAMSGTLSRLKV